MYITWTTPFFSEMEIYTTHQCDPKLYPEREQEFEKGVVQFELSDGLIEC
jgi:hypothetical protein